MVQVRMTVLGRGILGLDLSLTSTGMVMLSDTGEWVQRNLVTTTPQQLDMKRYDLHLGGVLDFVDHWEPAVVGIEAGVYGHGDSRPHELLGIVKHALWKRGQRVATWAPNTIKKFATGNHRASKQEMMEAAEAAGFELPRGRSGSYGAGADDLADAYWVARKTLDVQ